jgi:hypothetical protein
MTPVRVGLAMFMLCLAGCVTPAESPPPVGAALGPAPRVVLDTHFGRGWPDDRQATAWVTPDGYRLFARSAGQFVAVRSPLGALPADIVVSATLHKVGGPTGGGYGLIVSDQSQSAGDGLDQTGQYVVAAVGDRGEIGIWRREGDRWQDLVPWKRSAAVRLNAAPNDLAVTISDARLSFSVNGTAVASVDTGLRGGGVGVFTGGDANEVSVDRFVVQAPREPVQAIRSASGRPAPTLRPAGAAAPTPTAVPARPRATPTETPLTNDPGARLTAAGRVRDLLTSIFQDIGAILGSFANGPDSRNPVTDAGALKEAAGHLDSATSKATQLASELDTLENGGDHGNGR